MLNSRTLLLQVSLDPYVQSSN